MNHVAPQVPSLPAEAIVIRVHEIVATGVFTVDEVRELLGYPPIRGTVGAQLARPPDPPICRA